MLGDQMLRVLDALKEEGWVFAMQEELNQFERNKVSKNGRASNADSLRIERLRGSDTAETFIEYGIE
ncbi:hypothetical protein Tco_0510223, partial [Tanacetum coccineum]